MNHYDIGVVRAAVDAKMPGLKVFEIADRSAYLIVIGASQTGEAYSGPALTEFFKWFDAEFPGHAPACALPAHWCVEIAQIVNPPEARIVVVQGEHILGVYTTLDKAVAARDWYMKLTGAPEYQVIEVLIDEPIPPEPHWPTIKERYVPQADRLKAKSA